MPVVGDNRAASCYCRRCAADLSLISGAARFCPKCGALLDVDEPSPSRGSGFLSRLDNLFSTTMVRGYAHAMFRLGSRYEVRHNDREATRCYGKASRLGSEAARERLRDFPLAQRHARCKNADS